MTTTTRCSPPSLVREYEQLERLAQEHASALAAQAEALGAQQATAMLAEQERAKGEKDAELERARDQAGAMVPPHQGWMRRGRSHQRMP